MLCDSTQTGRTSFWKLSGTSLEWVKNLFQRVKWLSIQLIYERGKVYYNERTGTAAFALIEDNQRIGGLIMIT